MCGWKVLSATLWLLCAQSTMADDDSPDGVWDLSNPHSADEQAQRLRLWLTISAKKRFVEISWQNAPGAEGDHVLLTKQAPHRFEKVKLRTAVPLAAFDQSEGSGFVPLNGYTSSTARPRPGVGAANDSSSVEGSGADLPQARVPPPTGEYWISNHGHNDIVAAIKPTPGVQWFTTGVPFDYELSRSVTTNTSCYGYWASYINSTGAILAVNCLRAHPRWMTQLRGAIGGLRVRDLFIPGSHDSGSYQPNFDPLLRETIVTKYALTQDDDITGQLMHGARYLDIRVGYYRNTPELFFINHGITRQRPLQEIVDQVKEFVLATNEIVIFGMKEFPVGFGKSLGVHRLLVDYLQKQFGELIVHPSLSWRASLRDIWTQKQNIILAYDKVPIVLEFPHLLFGSVEQRWGNVKTWPKLEKHLKMINQADVSRFSSRPVADMAELTPDAWDILLDQLGGLRTMADDVNWRVSLLYASTLGPNANIVASDFMRGTTLVETALDWNRRKVIY